MKVIVLMRVYNEEMFIRRNLSNCYNLADKIVIAEGTVTPFGNLPISSTDNTFMEILDFKSSHEETNFEHGIYTGGKITLMPTWQGKLNNREEGEGKTNNMLLQHADPDDGDLLWNIDADEFLPQNIAQYVIDSFRKNNHLNCVRLKEHQFAYGLKYCFPSSHPRFIDIKMEGFLVLTVIL